MSQDEKVLIITNPVGDVAAISYALYDAALKAGGKPVLVFQRVKSQMDFAADEVIGAIGSAPDVLISMSNEKLGKDRAAIANPIKTEDGKEIDNYIPLPDGNKEDPVILVSGSYSRTLKKDGAYRLQPPQG